jgi:hypothetical protein
LTCAITQAGRKAAAERATTAFDGKTKEEHLQDLAEEQERAEIEKILVDENIQLLDDDDLQSLTYLDALTGSGEHFYI